MGSQGGTLFQGCHGIGCGSPVFREHFGIARFPISFRWGVATAKFNLAAPDDYGMSVSARVMVFW